MSTNNDQVIINVLPAELVTVSTPPPPLITVSVPGPQGIPGPQGEQGPMGVDANFVFTQEIPSAVWVCIHNLNKHCSVTVIDSSGDEVEGDVRHDSLDQVTLTFSGAFSGQAIFN